MPTIEERVAFLEGRAGDQAAALNEMRTEMRAEFRDVRAEIRDLRAETNNGFSTLRTEMDARFAATDAKITRLLGIQVAMLLMIASAALAYFFK